ncbi:LnmK family bifunctional acyltransferase/decarboxylase [Streptomyces sanyensis]|uniref:LnmK family bifunctional acyltransferase/decarboxylase n=1 Tax=Streptomyces sanyensis TaxID=568869 RepID=UPI003D7713EA
MTPAPAPVPAAGGALPPGPDRERVDAATVRRRRVVTPGMCGPSALLLGRIGDWTWETVADVCELDVLRARNESGDPAYLSFFYYRVRGSLGYHLRSPGFGDRLDILSRVFGFGSESVHTVHRISDESRAPALPPALEPDDFYAPPPPGCLHAETFNRWVSRGRAGSNRGLHRASPPGFRHGHLPRLPERYSPRLAYGRARSLLTFLDDPARTCRMVAEDLTATHTVDPVSDLNGVGLVYFAAYFTIVDRALLAGWRALGRAEPDFLARAVTDQQICYLGNADPGTRLETAVRVRAAVSGPPAEVWDAVVRDADSRELIAVCTQLVRTNPQEER